MQRPRRTTELVDVPGTATKRLTRSNIPSLAAPSPINGTAKKFPRQSRNTIRSSSQERVNNSAFLQVPSNGYAFGKITPQKTATPLTKGSTASRTLFTAEKRPMSLSSSTQPSGPLHNDKRWVQEQALLIMEFLDANAKPGQIVGVGSEFFSKGGGLKTMTIKQFVGIFNYFLSKISGSRLTVGTNHVEDIVKILQKLNYPHQINKSCLKTPNTQHSFGNIIMILSFLMDLAPPDLPEGEHLFDFQDCETTISSFTENLLKPDSQILARLMKDSAEGWYLWNEQLNDEYSACEQKTKDFLVQKICGLKNLKELEEDNQHLKVELDKLKESKPVLPKELEQLHKEMKYHQTELKAKYNQVEAEDIVIKKFEMKKSNWVDKVNNLKNEVEKLKNYLKNQKYKIEEFNKLIFDIDLMKYQHKVRQKTVEELSDMNDKQQVVLSRMKKYLTDEVDSFNAAMRQIHYFEGIVQDSMDLELTLNPNKEHLNAIIPTLRTLSEKLNKTILEQENSRTKIKFDIQTINCRVSSSLLPTLHSKQDLLRKEQNIFQNILFDMENKSKSYKKHIEKLEDSIQANQKELNFLEMSVKEKFIELEKKKKADELLMEQIEKEFKKNAEERIKSLEQYGSLLDEAESEMHKLSTLLDHVEITDAHIEKLLE